MLYLKLKHLVKTGWTSYFDEKSMPELNPLIEMDTTVDEDAIDFYSFCFSCSAIR